MEPLLIRLANEIRQTLHLVIGLLELTTEEPLSTSQLENLSHCKASADQLLRTANDVSELASSEPLAPSMAPFSLICAIGEVVDVMRILAERKDLELRCSLDSNVPDQIVADKDVIQGVLHRLLENSIKFTDSGSIAVSVTSRAVEPNSSVLILEIADTGTGMPSEVLASHFQSSEVPLSPGLGLPLVRKRLSEAAGEFSIIDSTCDGTILRISVPISFVAGGASRASKQQDELSSPDDSFPLKLLVVEDSDESFALFQAYVRGEGHRVSRALNGALGVEMVKSGEYDLVLMDVHMPVMDGYSATRTIREWETRSGRTRLPILLLSAEDRLLQMRSGALVGCSGYITKPARKSEVLRALNHFGKPAATRAE